MNLIECKQELKLVFHDEPYPFTTVRGVEIKILACGTLTLFENSELYVSSNIVLLLTIVIMD
jgi:hypothetical protein